MLRRRHHGRRYGLVSSVGIHGGVLVRSLVASSRVWVVVYPRVSSQLIRATEAFRAAEKGAPMGLFARVCAYVSCLVLEAVKGLIAERAFVGSRQILSLVFWKASDQGR